MDHLIIKRQGFEREVILHRGNSAEPAVTVQSDVEGGDQYDTALLFSAAPAMFATLSKIAQAGNDLRLEQVNQWINELVDASDGSDSDGSELTQAARRVIGRKRKFGDSERFSAKGFDVIAAGKPPYDFLIGILEHYPNGFDVVARVHGGRNNLEAMGTALMLARSPLMFNALERISDGVRHQVPAATLGALAFRAINGLKKDAPTGQEGSYDSESSVTYPAPRG